MNLLLVVIIIFVIIVVVFVYFKTDNGVVIKSTIDNKYYYVKKGNTQREASNMIANIRKNIIKISDAAYEKYKNDSEYEKYFKNLKVKAMSVTLSENVSDNNYTSYSVDKGDELVLCLRSKKNDVFHDMNLLTFVVIHELSHIACPEFGHTLLFKKIFIKLANIAIDIGLYNKINFKENNKEYCGMSITDSVV